MRGWLALIASGRSLTQEITAYAKLHALLEDFSTRPVIDFERPAAAQVEKLRGAKVRIGTMDLKIAAIALTHRALLLSRNLVDFRKVPGLHVEDWTVT